MPTNPPTLLSTLVSTVVLNLGNRTDLTTGSPSRIQTWLTDAYTDLCMSVPFEELQISLQDNFQPGIDTYNYPADARGIVTLSLNPSVQVGTPNILSQPIKRRNIQVVRRYSQVVRGVPAIYAPFNRQIVVRPVPDQGYQFIWDYWQLPQIASTPLNTIILTPPDWNEIIVWMATLRGHMGLLERDKAGELHTLLYGDPTDDHNPGLIKEKLLIHTSESIDSDFAIRPRIRSYGNTGHS